MKIRVAAFLLAALPLFGLAADDAAPPPSGDVDSLFSGDKGEAPDKTAKGADHPDVISDLLPVGIKLGAELSLLAGYSPGLNFLPGDVSDPSLIQYADMALLKMTSSLSINVRFFQDLALVGRLSATLPEFLLEVTDLYCDFDVMKAVFVRVGRSDIVWGISPNYPFTNLLARLPYSQIENENNKAADSITCRVSVPFGVGGVDLVAFSRTSLWASPTQPSVDEIGFGTKVNLALPNFDFTVGGYYHKDLQLRLFYSLSTTLFGSIEAYTEGVAATNILSAADPAAASWYFSANAGFYFDLFAKALRINAEYFYCGETADLTIKGADFTLFPGHNVALNASLSLGGGQWKIKLQGKYNISSNTGFIIPAVSLDVVSHIDFSIAVPVMLGPTDGGYFVQNTVNENRRICLVFAVVIKAGI